MFLFFKRKRKKKHRFNKISISHKKVRFGLTKMEYNGIINKLTNKSNHIKITF